jgi:hypothetical protein
MPCERDDLDRDQVKLFEQIAALSNRRCVSASGRRLGRGFLELHLKNCKLEIVTPNSREEDDAGADDTPTARSGLSPVP